jgi:hypothetical protein
MTRSRCRLPRIALVMAMLGIVTACEPGSIAGPPAACTQPGDRCQLASGPLGVCERAACPAGGTEPCFQCVPQH